LIEEGGGGRNGEWEEMIRKGGLGGEGGRRIRRSRGGEE
jgi:hypothetical protein